MSAPALLRKKPRPKTGGRPLPDSHSAPADADPIHLLEALKKRTVDPLDLTAEQRRACLVVLANGSRTTAELASLFQVCSRTVARDLRSIRGEIGRLAATWTLEEVVGQLLHAGEKYAAKAMAMEDVSLAWTIQRDQVKLLKELGFLGSEQHGVKITIESMGLGYERAREALGAGLDPRLTGRRAPRGPALSLERRPPGNGPETIDVPPKDPEAERIEQIKGLGLPRDLREPGEAPER